MKILIVEDDEVTLQAIEIKLKNDGFDPKGINNVTDALSVLENFEPDLIITDILMPHTSGLDFLSILRNQPGKKIPIIVLSSLGQENTVMEAFHLGANDFITKPFNPAELSTRVKKILKNKILFNKI